MSPQGFRAHDEDRHRRIAPFVPIFVCTCSSSGWGRPASTRGGSLRPRRSGCTAAGAACGFPGPGDGAVAAFRCVVRWRGRGVACCVRRCGDRPFWRGGAAGISCRVELCWSCPAVFSRAVRRACLVAFGGVWAAVSARRCYGRYVVMFVGVRGSCFEREETWPGACCISS